MQQRCVGVAEGVPRDPLRDTHPLGRWLNVTRHHRVGNMEVNAFQHSANVVLQKSIREGFGLVIAEAFWKGKPIVAGNATARLEIRGEKAEHLF
jgi:glycosyltransferase involved in cell wall biosynthesis